MRVGFTEFSDDIQDIAQRNPVCQRPLRRTLNNRSIRHRIGKRHAQLQNIRTVFHHTVHYCQSRPNVRVSNRNIRNQCLFTV
ncbi:hypothetical protein NM27_2148 [Neisseria meningitidis NM27]|nr:hypothetical protein NM27_2148 [Neisseria meningitidis NM27]